MKQSISISPLNSIVFVSAVPGGNVPVEGLDKSNIPFSNDVIIITCLCEIDGETHITLAHMSELDQRTSPQRDCFLDTQNRTISVWIVEGDKILSLDVPTERTRVRIWTNDPREPDEVIIGVGE